MMEHEELEEALRNVQTAQALASLPGLVLERAIQGLKYKMFSHLDEK